MAIVYQHIRKDNNKVFYIGIGKCKNRAYVRDGRNKYWVNIVNKFGYDIKVTHEDVCWEEACVIEKYLIEFYGRKDLGKGELVNMTDGGDGIFNISDESRKKISESAKKRIGPLNGSYGKKLSEERKDLIRQANLGEKNPRFGKVGTMKGRKGSLNPMYGKKRSDSKWIFKNRDQRAEKNPMYGKKHTEESKKKMSIKMKNNYELFGSKKSKQIVDIKTGEIYANAKIVCDLYNYNIITFRAWMNGQNKNKTDFRYR